jgi:hypothetical protein
MTAAELISLSRSEDRTVTAYPDTHEQYDTLLDDLLSSSDGDVDTAEHSGVGYSGPEARGRTEIWSEDGWRVELILPPARRPTELVESIEGPGLLLEPTDPANKPFIR